MHLFIDKIDAKIAGLSNIELYVELPKPVSVTPRWIV